MVEPSAVTKIGKSVHDAFHKEINQKDVLQKHMESYIEEELEKRRHGDRKGNSAKNLDAPEKRLTPEDQLYQTPDFLKQESVIDEEEVSGERWLAGITEVALPISYKLKNIEETEHAKQDMFAKRAAMSKEKEGPMPFNYNADFKRHKRDFDKAKREQTEAYHAAKTAKEAGLPLPKKEPESNVVNELLAKGGSNSKIISSTTTPAPRKKKQPGTLGVPHRGSGPGRERTVPYATDDRVLDRFVKRFKWK